MTSQPKSSMSASTVTDPSAANGSPIAVAAVDQRYPQGHGEGANDPDQDLNQREPAVIDRWMKMVEMSVGRHC
jgi:hypothetical protein